MVFFSTLRLIFLSSVHTWMVQTSRRQKTYSCSCAGPDQVLSLYRVAKGTKGRKGPQSPGSGFGHLAGVQTMMPFGAPGCLPCAVVGLPCESCPQTDPWFSAQAMSHCDWQCPWLAVVLHRLNIFHSCLFQHVCRDQRVCCKGWFSPSTT